VTSIYVSMGVTAGQYLHAQAPARPPKSRPS